MRKPEHVFHGRFGSLLIVIANHAGRTRVHLAHVDEVARIRLSPVDAARLDQKRIARRLELERASETARRKFWRAQGLTTKGTAPIPGSGQFKMGEDDRRPNRS